MNQFVPVPNFPEYLVSPEGIFLNKRNRKPLKFSNEKSGQYPKVKFNHKRYNAHRFLAIAFIPNPENKPFVNHKDGNKFNCTLGNLEWSTHDENMKHAQRTGLLVKGRQVHTNILDEAQVRTIFYCAEVSNKDLAKYFGIEPSNIYRIRKGDNWKHLKLVA